MINFAAKTSSEGECLVVSLSGECDLSVRTELASALADAASRCRVVVVDFAGLTFLDSSGIHELVTAYHTANEKGGHLYVRGASGIVATVLDLTGIGQLLGPPGDQHGPAKGSGP
jgi:anti-anti-sigma factor